jgi:hypothetical protein
MIKRFLLWIYRRTQQKPFNKCEVTFTSQHKRLKAKQFTNEGKMCLFQSSLLNKALETTELKQKRHNTISLIRPGGDAEVHNCFARETSLEPLAASSEWQSHVPKFGADGAASLNKMHCLVTLRHVINVVNIILNKLIDLLFIDLLLIDLLFIDLL